MELSSHKQDLGKRQEAHQSLALCCNQAVTFKTNIHRQLRGLVLFYITLKHKKSPPPRPHAHWVEIQLQALSLRSPQVAEVPPAPPRRTAFLRARGAEPASTSPQCCAQPLGHYGFPRARAGAGEAGDPRPLRVPGAGSSAGAPAPRVPHSASPGTHPPVAQSQMQLRRFPPECSPGPPQEQALSRPLCRRFSSPELSNFETPGSKEAKVGTARPEHCLPTQVGKEEIAFRDREQL